MTTEMLGPALKLVLLFQFALAALVPCHCVAKQYAAGETLVAASCCNGGSCRANFERDAAATARDLHLCPTPHRKSACPGRLLPDLAPPPAAPSDGLAGLFAGETAASGCAVTDLDFDRQARSPRASDSRAAPNIGNQSLLRQRCALII